MITYYAEISRNADSKTESSHSKISCKKDVLKHSLKSMKVTVLELIFLVMLILKRNSSTGLSQ